MWKTLFKYLKLYKVNSESVREWDLRVHMVPNLSPEHHIRNTVRVNFWSQYQNCFKNMEKMIKEYLQHITDSKYKYASSVWSYHLKKHTDLLDRVQCKGTKIVHEITLSLHIISMGGTAPCALFSDRATIVT